MLNFDVNNDGKVTPQELEKTIESHPLEAAASLPQGSDIQREAIQAIDGGRDAEVRNDVAKKATSTSSGKTAEAEHRNMRGPFESSHASGSLNVSGRAKMPTSKPYTYKAPKFKPMELPGTYNTKEVAMEEEFNLEETVQKLAEALTGLTQKIDELDTRLNEIDTVLYDGLIGPANDAIAENEYNNALSDFRCKYAEKLGPFESASKAIEGDDFDVFKSAFDNYNEGGYDFSPDEYVDKVAASLSEQIGKIKEAVADKLGVDEKEVSVEVNDNGEVEVEAEKEESKEGESKEGESKEGDETLEEFEESLKKEAEKDKDRSWIRG